MQVMLGFSFAFGWFGEVYVSYGTFCFACGCNSYPSLRVISFCLSLSRCCLVARVRVVNPQWVLRQREFFLEFYCAGHLWLKKKSFFHLGRFIKKRLSVGL